MVVAFVAEVRDIAVLNVHAGSMRHAVRLRAEGRDIRPPRQPLIGTVDGSIVGRDRRAHDRDLASVGNDGGGRAGVALEGHNEIDKIWENCVDVYKGFIWTEDVNG